MIEFKTYRLSVKNIAKLKKILEEKKKTYRKTTYDDVFFELIDKYNQNNLKIWKNLQKKN